MNEIRAKKSFGQNFLMDQNVISRIIDTCGFMENDVVLEIGPGKGALTERLHSTVSQFVAIDADKDMVEFLRKKYIGCDVRHQDILKFDLSAMRAPLKVIGNIPYNISSPIVIYLMRHADQISDIFMTVQLEFGKRLVAKPNTKDYSSLSCLAQYYYDSKLEFKISPHCFKPVPKVQSCFLSMKIKKKRELPQEQENGLFNMIQAAFAQRRKNIFNSLSVRYNKEKIENALEKGSISKTSRAENLTLDDFIRLYREL